MPGKHKNPLTISFRPSDRERKRIEQRVASSGLPKKDFITRSCVYSNIVVVGKKENIQRIIDSLQEMQNVITELAGLIQSGSFVLSDESYTELKEDYLAFLLAVSEILDGSACLFDKQAPECNTPDSKIEEYRKLLEKG
ncbi:MAG: hypothetical protein IJ192_02710 [Clostridia bacterium]|nr:hypothetical protein [Clostridia bacterium]